MKKFICFFTLVFVFMFAMISFAETNFNGTWQTNWGPMYLVQKGNNVTGTYDYNYGKLKGTISGDKLTYTWNESSSKYTSSGTGYFILKKDNSLSGQWKNDGVQAWEGDWTATRSNTKTI